LATRHTRIVRLFSVAVTHKREILSLYYARLNNSRTVLFCYL
jgi:hypothetical protein